MPMKQLYIGLIALMLAACDTLPTKQRGPINHVVLVWFKDSVNAGEIAEVRAGTLELQTIPGIRSIQVGTAVPSRRTIVDDSFDLGIVMTFDSAADMRAYLEHPQHQAFVQRFIKGRVNKLLVYDIDAESH